MRRNIYREEEKLLYLLSGCDSARIRIEMDCWIKEKGLEYVYGYIRDHFGDSWYTKESPQEIRREIRKNKEILKYAVRKEDKDILNYRNRDMELHLYYLQRAKLLYKNKHRRSD